MFKFEQKLVDQLKLLKEEFSLQAVKAEFEAEGSSLRDVARLRHVRVVSDFNIFIKGN